MFDREGHGYISVVDLKDVLTLMGERLSLEECEELLEEADIDRDGNIFYDEFIAMIFKVELWCRLEKDQAKPMFCFRVPVLRRKGQSTKQERA